MDNEGHNLHIPVRMSAWGLFQKSTLVSFLLKFQAYKEIQTKNGIKNISKFNLQIRIKNWAQDNPSRIPLSSLRRRYRSHVWAAPSHHSSREGSQTAQGRCDTPRSWNENVTSTSSCSSTSDAVVIMYRKWPTSSKANITFFNVASHFKIQKQKTRQLGREESLKCTRATSRKCRCMSFARHCRI